MSRLIFRDVIIVLFFFFQLFLGLSALLEYMRDTFHWFGSLSMPVEVLVAVLAVFWCICYLRSLAPPPSAATTSNISTVAMSSIPTAATSDPPTAATSNPPIDATSISPAVITARTPVATTANELPIPAPRHGVPRPQPRPSAVGNGGRPVQDHSAAKEARMYAHIASINARMAALSLASAAHVTKNAELKTQLATVQAENAILRAALETEKRRVRAVLGFARTVVDGARRSNVGEPQEDRYMHDFPPQAPQPEAVEHCNNQARLPTAMATPLTATLHSETSRSPLLLPHDLLGSTRADNVVTAGRAPRPQEGSS
ncbi:hypothetical protein C8Q73DRAFT_787373 [Cubamyces lactineus]|nr:hypothetical protein C8Q73DRAFT_787373 [Cubamyces lactineus]